MKRIAFYQPHICIHGTTVSYNDYSLYNQDILGNESIMFYDKNHPANNEGSIKKFKEHTEIIPLDGNQNMEMLSRYLKKYQCDAIYIQKCGKKDDGRYIDSVPMLVHVVGREKDPHGYIYAYVSRWLSKECSNLEYPFIPYIVRLPEHTDNLRESLGINPSDTVFSRIGGIYAWDIPFVQKSILNTLQSRNDVWFLFANTPKFIEHDRVIFLNAFSDLYFKRSFINTSDAFLHARYIGESFGMACAEYSICNKRVITYSESPEKNHIETLGNKGIYYNSERSLTDLLINFKKENGDFNCYKDFNPSQVMNMFKSIFLDKI